MKQEVVERFLSRATLRQIEVMVALQTHKSMTAAAEHLGMSVANVSRTCARFEASLELQLFVSGARRRTLLPDAGIVIDCLKPVLREIDDLRSNLAEIDASSLRPVDNRQA